RPLETGRILVVALPADDLHEQQRRLLTTLGVAGGLGVAAATLASWLVAGGLSRRLRHGADAAHAIAAGASDERATQPGRDEVTVLTAAVDDLADALTARLQREREFSADVAHELRTPVTALVSAAELLGDDETSALVRRQVGRLRALVEQLLELSRLEAGTDAARTEPLNLKTAVERSLEALPATSSDDFVTVHVNDPATVSIEQARLDRILANLVLNSHRHGASSCVVTVSGATVTVTDDGPGYPPHVLDAGPQRFASRPGGGSGLGLVIAQRQAQALGAELTFSNGGGGAVATLTFLNDGSTPAPPFASGATPAP
ncbi:MAG: HAMP domain-containing sensor histidine kinase, partial [Mobilicoccus sp.]|nr:HAMP domain-containing sensor histidine kinase [Mobilicoccus sp.]